MLIKSRKSETQEGETRSPSVSGMRYVFALTIKLRLVRSIGRSLGPLHLLLNEANPKIRKQVD